jgi:hypothetical protein
MKAILNKSPEPPIPDSAKLQLDCFPFIFSIEELEILEKKGHILKALAEGKRSPASSAERSFVKFCRDRESISSAMETAWIKYLHRRELEATLLETEELYLEYRRNRGK